MTRSLEFRPGDHTDQWLDARLEDLDYGYIDGIKAAVRKYLLEGIKQNDRYGPTRPGPAAGRLVL